MGLDVTYKGQQIAQLTEDGSVTLNTAGKYCEGNIGLTYSGGGAAPGSDIYNPMGTRLSDLPDLSVLDRSGQVLYMVVDTMRANDPLYSKVGLRAPEGSSSTFERGCIVNGAYVVNATWEMRSAQYFSDDLDTNSERFWIYRITAPANIVRIDAYTPVSGNTGYAPIIAYYGNLPHLTTPNFISALQYNVLSVDVANIRAVPTSRQVYIAKYNNLTGAIPENMFYTNANLAEIDMTTWNIDASTTLAGLFYNAPKLRTLKIGTHNTSGVKSIQSMFQGAVSINDIDLSGLDLSGVTNAAYAFYGAKNLSTITGWTNIPVSYALNNSMLTHDSMMVVINALPTVATTQTLTLGSDNLSRLTAEEIAVATAKGWEVT